MSLRPPFRALAAGLALAAFILRPAPLGAQEAPEEFVVAFNEMEPELDPHRSIYSAEAQIFTAVYEGLFTYEPESLDPLRAACASFTKSRDGRTYTFRIRDDARWSDGTPLLARDFREAWLRALEPARKAEYASFFDVIAGAQEYRTGKNRDPGSVGITARGGTLEVKLRAPAPYFTRLLCHHSFSPVHPSMMGAADWSSRIPFPVNGPFRLLKSGKGELLLERNPEYWDRDNVRLAKLRFVFTDDDKDASRRFDNREIHWLAGPMDFESLLDRAAISLNPMFGTQYWFFDSAGEPWKDPRIRKALALLLPLDKLREDFQMPAETLVLPFEGYDGAEGLAKADEEAARKLLAEAGKADGKGLPPLVIMIPAGSEDLSAIAAAMKEAWDRLPGLEVRIKSVPSSRYFAEVRLGPAKGGFTLGLTTWIGDFADPVAFLQMWTADSNLNDAGYADPEFDRLLARSAEEEGERRYELLAEAESRLLDSAACIPLHHSIAANVIDLSWIEGWFPNALDVHPFKHLGFGAPKVRPNVARATP